MKNTKGQMSGGGMALVGLFAVLIVVGVIQLVAVLTTSKVDGNLRDQIPLTTTTVQNESVTIVMMTGATNSTLLSRDGYIQNSERVATAANKDSVLTRGTNYTVTFQKGTSGQVFATANFTLITPLLNNTALKITYDVNDENSYHTSADQMRSQNLDSMELGSTGQTVLAAGVIISVVVGFVFFVRGQ